MTGRQGAVIVRQHYKQAVTGTLLSFIVIQYLEHKAVLATLS